MKNILVFIILQSIFISAFAGESLSLGLGFVKPSLQVDLHSTKKSDSKVLEFRPNQANSTALLTQYGNLGLSLKTRNKMEGNELEIPLNSDAEDYQIRFFGKTSSFEMKYQSYRGYYIENYRDYDTSLNNSSSEILFPDLRTTNFAFNYIYNFRPEKLSLEAAFGISESQEKSGGSWLAGAFLSRQSVESNKALAPSFTGTDFSEFQNYLGSRQSNLGISGGYGYYYTKEKYFASLLAMISLAYQKQKLEFTDSSKDQEVSTVQTAINLALGYNSKKHRVAFTMLANSIRTPVGSGAMNSSTIDLGIYYVYRWNNLSIPYLEPASKWVGEKLSKK